MTSGTEMELDVLIAEFFNWLGLGALVTTTAYRTNTFLFLPSWSVQDPVPWSGSRAVQCRVQMLRF